MRNAIPSVVQSHTQSTRGVRSAAALPIANTNVLFSTFQKRLKLKGGKAGKQATPGIISFLLFCLLESEQTVYPKLNTARDQCPDKNVF